MRIFAGLLVLFLTGASSVAGQSCGAGVAKFFFPAEGGARLIPNVSLTLLTVDDNQGWMSRPPSAWHELGVKETDVSSEIAAAAGATSLKNPDRVWRITDQIYEELMTGRRQLLATKTADLFDESDARASTFINKADGIPQIRTREGCGWMVAGKFEADGYETGYFVGHFTCGCDKYFVLRLTPLGTTSSAKFQLQE